jgi:hypothetical protein
VGDLARKQFKSVRDLARIQFKGVGDLVCLQFKSVRDLARIQFRNVGDLARIQFKGVGDLACIQFRNVGARRDSREFLVNLQLIIRAFYYRHRKFQNIQSIHQCQNIDTHMYPYRYIFAVISKCKIQTRKYSLPCRKLATLPMY